MLATIGYSFLLGVVGLDIVVTNHRQHQRVGFHDPAIGFMSGRSEDALRPRAELAAAASHTILTSMADEDASSLSHRSHSST